jgi:hypothetical protein
VLDPEAVVGGRLELPLPAHAVVDLQAGGGGQFNPTSRCIIR